MADPEPKPAPIRRSRTAEVADALSDGAVRIGRLTPQQVLGVIAVGILGFVCAMQAFTAWADREERKEVARERQDVLQGQIRENNSQSELTRQHCAAESTQLRTFFADQNEKRMRFESEERAKDRAAIAALVSRLADLEKAIGKH